jgi:NhaA family Na+:H+ antiporter
MSFCNIITNLAFAGSAETISASKMAILLASLTAGTIGFLWLKLLAKPETTDSQMDLKQSRQTQ